MTTAQLRAAGLSRSAVSHRVRHGRLFRWHRGVYRVGVPTSSREDAIMAALLAAGAHAAVSHTTAAALLELLRWPDGPIELTVAGREARLTGVKTHTTMGWQPGERIRIGGIPITSVERTLLDLGASGADIEHPTNEALARRVTTRQALEVAAGARRAGSARLRAVIDGEQARGFTRSEAERRLRALIRDAGLPSPSWNARLHGREADAVWPEARLVVEVDGFATHGRRSAFEQDRARDADRLAQGWRTMRVTWRQLEDEPVRVAARLAAGLASRA